MKRHGEGIEEKSKNGKKKLSKNLIFIQAQKSTTEIVLPPQQPFYGILDA